MLCVLALFAAVALATAYGVEHTESLTDNQQMTREDSLHHTAPRTHRRHRPRFANGIDVPTDKALSGQLMRARQAFRQATAADKPEAADAGDGASNTTSNGTAAASTAAECNCAPPEDDGPPLGPVRHGTVAMVAVSGAHSSCMLACKFISVGFPPAPGDSPARSCSSFAISQL